MMRVAPQRDRSLRSRAAASATTARSRSVSTDTRTLKPGALFVALSGPNFDGHDFVAAAAERGAAAALVERPLAVAVAAGRRRRSARQRCPRSRASGDGSSTFRVVGVTGSNGKTTTKELIGSILSRLGPDAGHARQSEQSHRRAADAARADRRRIATPSSRWARIIIGEIAHLASIAEPTDRHRDERGRGAPRRLRQPRRRRDTARARCSARCRPKASRSSMPTTRSPRMWRDASAAERVLTFGFEQPADFMAHKVQLAAATPTGFRTDFDLVTPYGTQRRDAWRSAACTTCAMRSAPPRLRARPAPSSTRSSPGSPR